MTTSMTGILTLVLALCTVCAAADAPMPLKSAKAEFVADSNVKMFKFGGTAKDIESKVIREGDRLVSLEIRIPVKELKTGMEIRDKHMRERIFTAPDGSTPDIVFTSSKSDCKPAPDGSESCAITGLLAFRGVQKPFELTATLTGGVQVKGQGTIDVLEFGVDPEQLKWTGVAVNPKPTFDFEAELP